MRLPVANLAGCIQQPKLAGLVVQGVLLTSFTGKSGYLGFSGFAVERFRLFSQNNFLEIAVAKELPSLA